MSPMSPMTPISLISPISLMTPIRPIIKVCGMRDADNIRELDQLCAELSIANCQLSINMMGFIFWPKSIRYVSERPAYLPHNAKRVGVFVNENIDRVKRTRQDYALDFIQLHGQESPAYIRQLHSVCGNAIAIIKAFNISTPTDLQQTAPYVGLADYFLFDTKAQLPGGNGQQFDWGVLADYVGETPFLLSGGISPDDAPRIRNFHHPKCIGIDLNSRFESSPALKDINKLKTFIQAL